MGDSRSINMLRSARGTENLPVHLNPGVKLIEKECQKLSETQQIDCSRPLPTPTRDLEAMKADLDSWGYCYIKDAMTPEQIRHAKIRIDDQAEAECLAGVSCWDGGKDRGRPNQRIYNLLNKDDGIFEQMTLHPTVMELMQKLLGSGFLISSVTCNIARKGGNPMTLHQDQNYVRKPLDHAVAANALFMVDDFTEQNGGTLVCPRSHVLTSQKGFKGTDLPKLMNATGPAGTCLVFDGRLIHGTGTNKTDSPRTAILCYFCSSFIRQQDNPFLSISPEVYKKASDELKKRWGYRQYGTLGGVEGSRHKNLRTLVEVPKIHVGYLTRDMPKEQLLKNYDRKRFANSRLHIEPLSKAKL